MSIKNLVLIVCLITTCFNQANAVYSSKNSIPTKENSSQKLTLKDRLQDVWVAKKLKKLEDNNVAPPDLNKCLTINLKNRQIHKAYQLQIKDNSITYKKCNSKSDKLNDVKLEDVQSITSTDGENVYFEQPTATKVSEENSTEKPITHPAVILGAVLTIGGIGISLWLNIFFGMIMVLTGVLLALVTRKLLKRNRKQWKGLSLVNLITGLGVGVLYALKSLVDRIK